MRFVKADISFGSEQPGIAIGISRTDIKGSSSETLIHQRPAMWRVKVAGGRVGKLRVNVQVGSVRGSKIDIAHVDHQTIACGERTRIRSPGGPDDTGIQLKAAAAICSLIIKLWLGIVIEDTVGYCRQHNTSGAIGERCSDGRTLVVSAIVGDKDAHVDTTHAIVIIIPQRSHTPTGKCRIIRKGTVDDSIGRTTRISVSVCPEAPAVNGKIGGKSTVTNRSALHLVIYRQFQKSASGISGRGSRTGRIALICIAPSDGKSVHGKTGAGRGVSERNHVIRIVGRIPGYTNIPAEDRRVCSRIRHSGGSLRTIEAPIEAEIICYSKGGSPVGGGGRIVSSFRHPDLIAGGINSERLIQVIKSRGPGKSRPGRAVIYIDIVDGCKTFTG